MKKDSFQNQTELVKTNRSSKLKKQNKSESPTQ